MTNSPIDTIRDGSLKATIWKNLGDNGNFYSTTFSRTYKVGEDFKDADSYSGTQLLRISRLAQRAYDRELELRQADRAALENGGAA